MTTPSPVIVPSEVRHERVERVDADAVVINLFRGVTTPGGATGAIDQALDGAIGELIRGGDVKGELGEVAVIYPRGAVPARRVLVVGLGSTEEFGLEQVRRASAAAASKARELGARTLATIVHGAGIGGLDVSEAAQATLEGALLASYRFASAKRGAADAPRLERIAVVEAGEDRIAAVREGVRAAQAIARGVARARDLVNRPPNVANPAHLAQAARDIAADGGLRVHVGDRVWAARHRMFAFLAVAEGSANEPAFVELEHNAGRDDLPAIVLVGKGVTFDSGGLSLKTRDGMMTMKSDMAGAAAVLGAMQAVAELDLPLRVVGLCPCVENMPDGQSYRPGDVVTAGDGTSIEVLNTDAEGRLALADALAYAKTFAPAAVVDIATLTGASVTALGSGVSSSLFATDPTLRARLETAAEASGERVWPMPLFEEYRKTIDSNVADLKNTGGASGGVGTAAVFLQAFTSYPWAHVDMAGMALVDDAKNAKGKTYLTPGATGYGVRLLVEFLRDWA